MLIQNETYVNRGKIHSKNNAYFVSLQTCLCALHFFVVGLLFLFFVVVFVFFVFVLLIYDFDV